MIYQKETFVFGCAAATLKIILQFKLMALNLCTIPETYLMPILISETGNTFS